MRSRLISKSKRQGEGRVTVRSYSPKAASFSNGTAERAPGRAKLKNAFLMVLVECYFVDFAGVWQLESGILQETK